MAKFIFFAKLCVCSILFVILINSSMAYEKEFVDAHIHFNWDQENISAKEVLETLQKHNVSLAVVSSIPSVKALELTELDSQRIVAFYSPYTHELGKRDWFTDKTVLTQAEKALASKKFHGIGEVHFMAGFPPKTNNHIFIGLLKLAQKYDVPLLIHIDSANESSLLSICKKFSEVKLIFAHAGGNLHAKHINKILSQCPNVWVEFSARDPWRYNGITAKLGVLLDEWRDLVLAFPDRFFTGTDPVWRVTRTQSWDQADDGWDHYAQLVDFHRKWIAALPVEVQEKVRSSNAKKLLRRN